MVPQQRVGSPTLRTVQSLRNAQNRPKTSVTFSNIVSTPPMANPLLSGSQAAASFSGKGVGGEKSGDATSSRADLIDAGLDQERWTSSTESLLNNNQPNVNNTSGNNRRPLSSQTASSDGRDIYTDAESEASFSSSRGAYDSKPAQIELSGSTMGAGSDTSSRRASYASGGGRRGSFYESMSPQKAKKVESAMVSSVSAAKLNYKNRIEHLADSKDAFARTSSQDQQQRERSNQFNSAIIQAKKEREEMLEQLSNTSFGAVFRAEHLALVVQECDIRRYDVGEIVFRANVDCRAMFLILDGKLGMYRFPEGTSDPTNGDPVRLENRRVREYGKGEFVLPGSCLCGVETTGFYAAMSSMEVICLPSHSVQPVLSNQVYAAQGAGEWLSKTRDASEILAQLGKGRLKQGTMSAYAFQKEVTKYMMKDKAASPWMSSPRSKAKNPRAYHKTPDVPIAQASLTETSPCVGTKGAPMPTPSEMSAAVRQSEHAPPRVVGNQHLSPRLYSTGVNAWGLSTRDVEQFQGAKGLKANGMVICEAKRVGGKEESWNEQERLVEKPLVRSPGSAIPGFTRIFKAKGTTSETLEELQVMAPEALLERSLHSEGAQFKTLLGRQVAMKADNIFKTRPPTFQCQISKEPHGSDMRSQMIADVTRASRPTARQCQAAVDEEEKKRREEGGGGGQGVHMPKLRERSYECSTRHDFIMNEDSTMLRQMGEPKFGELDSAAPITSEEADYLGEKMEEWYPAVFPAKPTLDMLRATPYILKKGLDLTMPPSANVQSLPKGFKFGTAPGGGVKQDGSVSPVRRRMELKDGKGAWWSPKENSKGGEESEWMSDMQQAMATGLLKGMDRHGKPIDPLAAPRPTFVARCRQEAPFITVNGKLTLRDSHDFGDSIKVDKHMSTPQSSVEHMMHKEALSLKDQVVDEPRQHRTWTVALKTKMHTPDMQAMLAHPAPTTRLARALDRRAWDGGAASSRAPEDEETGRPMVADPDPKKTRMAVLGSKQLSGRQLAPRPTWVCWERHQTHQ